MIALHCSESSKAVLVKAKYADILILINFKLLLKLLYHMTRIYRSTIPRLLALKTFIKMLEKQLVCAYFVFLLLAATPLATSSEYQKHLISNDC